MLNSNAAKSSLTVAVIAFVILAVIMFIDGSDSTAGVIASAFGLAVFAFALSYIIIMVIRRSNHHSAN